ncbi:hypothetical protein [Rhodobacter capsulatus]|jgi:hypothetical protein|uniref:hypothetical protein n=2 Tax=Rhodobacter capsulatus TaxID=1061 RepID=UPI00103B55DD|nr:hypothetical protein [Rhodobacter capsulatus]MDS0925974.1 hypothetical protein [Rhodobacter capsulatus]TQD35999.1 hypothetical protein FKW81_05120 [Rhodobacter capsulatus]
MSLVASVSAVSSVTAVSGGSSRAAASQSAAAGGGVSAVAAAGGTGSAPSRKLMGQVIEASLAGPVTRAKSQDTTPQSGLRDVSKEARQMPENPASDRMKREIASTETQPAGAVYSVKKIAAEAASEMKVREPTQVEVLKDQQAGGKPGGNVEELNALIEQTSPLAQKTDLSQTRTDISKQDDALRQMSEQALAEGRARRGTSLTDKPSAQEQMQSQQKAAQAREGAYSTMSLTAVSPDRQHGRTVRLTM